MGLGYYVAGVADRVGGWYGGVEASGGIRRGRGGEKRDGDDGVADGGRKEEAAVDVGGEIGGGGRGEGGAGGSLFSFHVESGFLRDGGSVGKGSLVEFSQNMVEVGFLWGGAGVDELVNSVEEFEMVREEVVVVRIVLCI